MVRDGKKVVAFSVHRFDQLAMIDRQRGIRSRRSTHVPKQSFLYPEIGYLYLAITRGNGSCSIASPKEVMDGSQEAALKGSDSGETRAYVEGPAAQNGLSRMG